jgi:hypothetical protein
MGFLNNDTVKIIVKVSQPSLIQCLCQAEAATKNENTVNEDVMAGAHSMQDDPPPQKKKNSY